LEQKDLKGHYDQTSPKLQYLYKYSLSLAVVIHFKL